MFGRARYREVCIERLIIEIEKILYVECYDADIAGRFGLFGGSEVNE